MVTQHNSNGVSWIEAGQGQSVILLHGMPGSRVSWTPQFEHLSKSFRVIAWDMPGYGESDLREDLITPALMAKFLATAMKDNMFLDQAHVVGLSLGGMIGMELALENPDLVTSLTLLDSSPKFGLDGGSDASGFVTSVQKPLDEGKLLPDLCREILQDLVWSEFTGEQFETALNAMSRATPKGLVQAAALIGNHDALDRLGNIGATTLVMSGEHDAATPSEYSKIIAAKIPNAHFVEIPDAGHLSNLENPGFVNDQLLKFLSLN